MPKELTITEKLCRDVPHGWRRVKTGKKRRRTDMQFGAADRWEPVNERSVGLVVQAGTHFWRVIRRKPSKVQKNRHPARMGTGKLRVYGSNPTPQFSGGVILIAATHAREALALLRNFKPQSMKEKDFSTPSLQRNLQTSVKRPQILLDETFIE